MKVSLQTNKMLPLVAPLVGAWIERSAFGFSTTQENVAPLVGAWIESVNVTEQAFLFHVAPLVGAWIESVYGMCVQKCVKESLLL